MVVLQAKSPVIVLLLLCVISVSCNKRNSSIDIVTVDAKVSPVIHTEDVSSLISDSGVTRYRLNAKVWDVYSDNVDEPYWHFPEGIYIEKFDSLFNIEASVVADTAYHFEKRGLWQAIGNVMVKNIQGDLFETSELFWNQKEGVVYSDKFLRVTRKDRIFTGIGVRSNQEMTKWRFFETKAEIDVNDSDSAIVAPDDTLMTNPDQNQSP